MSEPATVPAAAPAAPAPAAPPPAKPPAKSLQETAPTFFSKLRDGDDAAATPRKVTAKPAEPPAPAPEPKPAEPPPPAAPAPTEPAPAPEPKKKVIKAKGYAAPVDLDLIRQTAAATAAEMSKSMQPPPAPPAPTPAAEELNDEEKKTITVLRTLEQINPSYKGITGRAVQAIREIASSESAFSKQWLASNPLDDFEDEPKRTEAMAAAWEEERKSILDRHNVSWETEDYIEAKAMQRLAPALGERDSRIQNLEKMIKKQQAEPILAKTGVAAVEQATEMLGIPKEFVGKNGKVVDIEGFHAADPVAAPVYNDALNVIFSFARDCRACFDGLAEAEVMRAVSPICEQFENYMQALDPEDRVEDGKSFCTLDQWSKMNEAQRARFWIADAAHVIGFFNAQASEKARTMASDQRARLERQMAALGYSKTPGAPAPAPAPQPVPGNPPAAQPVVVPSRKPSSPPVTITPAPLSPRAAPAPSGNRGAFLTMMMEGSPGSKRE